MMLVNVRVAEHFHRRLRRQGNGVLLLRAGHHDGSGRNRRFRRGEVHLLVPTGRRAGELGDVAQWSVDLREGAVSFITCIGSHRG